MFVQQTFGVKRNAFLSETGLYGKLGADTIVSKIEMYPETSIVAHEKMETTDTTVIPQLAKIEGRHVDLLIIYATVSKATAVAKNYRQFSSQSDLLNYHCSVAN